jgi:hypothetical protein
MVRPRGVGGRRAGTLAPDLRRRGEERRKERLRARGGALRKTWRHVVGGVLVSYGGWAFGTRVEFGGWLCLAQHLIGLGEFAR